MDDYERLAKDLVLAYDTQDQAALQRLNGHYRRTFTFDDLAAEIWRRVYAFRQRSSRVPKNYLQLAEAQLLVAQDAGYGSWAALTSRPIRGATAAGLRRRHDRQRHAPRRRLNDAEWEQLGVMQERRIPVLEANGLMTDAVLARVADFDHVTGMLLGGSRQVTDEAFGTWPNAAAAAPGPHGCQAHRPRDGRAADLPRLRTFDMTWQRGITDAGVANLRACDRLEHVNLMGTPVGDEAIAALRGKPHLHSFSSGRPSPMPACACFRVSSAEDKPRQAEKPGRLLIDGPFTDDGLASLAGLDGVGELDLFWHATGITSEGFAHLAHLPNLEALGADGELSDDVAMGHFARLPRLRRLRAQGTVATDNGFEALSHSATLESLWGRECPHLGSRGFLALSRLPELRGLGVSCKGVTTTRWLHCRGSPPFASSRPLTSATPGLPTSADASDWNA